MKLHRLTLEGFGPFRDRQVVDFDAFDADGIFLITGRTGAGKSSILDGVCFALYGGVPRYESGEKRLRSDHSGPDDPTEVSLELTVGDARWRVTRSPEYERPKRRGEGWAKVGAAAQLDELVAGEWVGRASGPRNVAEVLDGVLQLNMQQFLQVILLAQNRFARFLLADNKERQAVLRTLFGSRRFEDYERDLDERRKRAERELERSGGEVALLLGEAERTVAENDLGHPGGAAASSPEPPAAATALRIAEVERALLRADHRVEVREFERAAAEASHRDADAAHAARVAVRAAQERRARSRELLAALEARAPETAAERARFDRAQRAEATRTPIELARRAAEELDAATARERAARSAWAQMSDDYGTDGDETDVDQLRADAETLSGELAVWSIAEREERELADLDARLAALRARLTEHESARDAIDVARAQLPAARADIEARLPERAQAAGALGGARAQRDALLVRLAAAREAERLDTDVRLAETAHLDASRALEHATGAVRELLQRRLEGFAAELSGTLIDDAPCPVCGATEHPHPAPPSDEPVTAAHIDDAEERTRTAIAAERAAADAAASARARHAAAAAQAGGDGVAAIADALAVAESAVTAAQDARADVERLEAERSALVAADEAALVERAALDAEVVAAREAVAAALETAGAARRRVDEARGEYASVAERVAVASARRTHVHSLIDALETVSVRTSAATRAAADRDAAIARAGFDDETAAVGALLTADERAALDARLRAHDAALEAERTRLRDLELQLVGEPDDLVDTDVSAQAASAARERWVGAVEAAQAAVHAADRLRDYVVRVSAAYAGVAELAERHAAVAGLAAAVAGRNDYRMTLETFVLAAELEEIVASANTRLGDMSAGRYVLRHSDSRAARNAASGLGLEVVDAHTGQARPTQSLSGGETFLASLALALGLAEVVTARAGGIRLDTLFVDEGFGALDADTLDLAMRTLDELRQGGRTVGVISHVEAMKEELPAQLVVEATPQGPSIITQDASEPLVPFPSRA